MRLRNLPGAQRGIDLCDDISCHSVAFLVRFWYPGMYGIWALKSRIFGAKLRSSVRHSGRVERRAVGG